jgi:hypothetical protein
MHPTTTKTTYFLCLFRNGRLDRSQRGADCASPDLAGKGMGALAEANPSWTTIALVQEDSRLGDDGAWHPTAETILALEVL